MNSYPIHSERTEETNVFDQCFQEIWSITEPYYRYIVQLSDKHKENISNLLKTPQLLYTFFYKNVWYDDARIGSAFQEYRNEFATAYYSATPEQKQIIDEGSAQIAALYQKINIDRIKVQQGLFTLITQVVDQVTLKDLLPDVISPLNKKVLLHLNTRMNPPYGANIFAHQQNKFKSISNEIAGILNYYSSMQYIV